VIAPRAIYQGERFHIRNHLSTRGIAQSDDERSVTAEAESAISGQALMGDLCARGRVEEGMTGPNGAASSAGRATASAAT
jgi:hypothetical protein